MKFAYLFKESCIYELDGQMDESEQICPPLPLQWGHKEANANK